MLITLILLIRLIRLIRRVSLAKLAGLAGQPCTPPSCAGRLNGRRASDRRDCRAA